MNDKITIRGARLHNLKNVTLSIPKNKLVVFTGLSGSGKSTLALDTLHNEGQRQFMESLGMVTHGLSKGPLDSIEGLSPSISVDQHLTNHSPRSTVGTATEVFTYLRVLFARAGHRPCQACGQDVPPFGDQTDSIWDDEEGADSGMEEAFPCPHCGAPVPEMGMASFSFNKPAGACSRCTGLGIVLDGNLEKLIDPSLSISEGGVIRWDWAEKERYQNTLQVAASRYGFDFDVHAPIGRYGLVQRDLLLYGVHSPQFRRHFPDVEPPDNVYQGRFEGIITTLLRRYAERSHDTAYREKLENVLIKQVCPDCEGTRLRPESRRVTVAGETIIAVASMPLIQLSEWVELLPQQITADEMLVAEAVIDDLKERIRRLVDTGVGYLTLDRASPSLSAGEAQRLRLAALLGSGLTGVLYVLDEPTIGLHPRDSKRLIEVMRQLRDLGNTVLVIEHDLDMVRAADFVADIGPGAGKHGGEVVALGTPADLEREPASLTGQYLSGAMKIETPRQRRKPNGKYLTVYGARQHNLRRLTVRFPLGLMIAVTGVSGSGKSTLAFDILDVAARQRFNHASDIPGAHDAIEGWEYLDKIVTIDQAPIGRVPRSNAATYTDAFTPIRETFARTAEAEQRGLTARHFSFNVPGGRCERCEGAGVLSIEMHFLPTVQVRCPSCRGRRFKKDVLAVKYQGYDIAEILEMTIEEALPLFVDVPAVAARLRLMVEVGMGYLQLGQPATTLSGGEAQRVKLAKELSRRSTGRTLYLLDEPTTGLHVHDVAHLLKLLQSLVDAGNTVLVIEHNLDVIKSADWVIDLGPEGGAAGGELIAEGPPEVIAQVERSYTGQWLRSLQQSR
jgi:excinuclease ABC subunit A